MFSLVIFHRSGKTYAHFVSHDEPLNLLHILGAKETALPFPGSILQLAHSEKNHEKMWLSQVLIIIIFYFYFLLLRWAPVIYGHMIGNNMAVLNIFFFFV